ncbi:hypothetical protein T492DRAFT_140431 [Pavlovales sp. CCMP2436]|nr:hypothetical protein T492DRAFT_140431 [Pavlovales sp. CCMP2436]
MSNSGPCCRPGSWRGGAATGCTQLAPSAAEEGGQFSTMAGRASPCAGGESATRALQARSGCSGPRANAARTPTPSRRHARAESASGSRPPT